MMPRHSNFFGVCLSVLVFYLAILSVMPQTSTKKVDEVLLVDGNTKDSGRVSVLVGGNWGYVCATMFDDYDAKVVCNQLGYSGDAYGYRDGRYGPPVGTHHLSHLDCSGTELSLQDCPRNNTSVLNRNARNYILEDTRNTAQTCNDGHASVQCFNRIGTVDAELSRILPRKCGQPTDASQRFVTSLAKIREGANINRFETPWIASIYKGSKTDSHYCGGVVISEDYILTAGHCIFGIWLPDLMIRVGEHNRDIDDSNHQDFEVENAVIHEHYDEVFRGDNDIALVKIKKKSGTGIRFNERVQPICLPKTGTEYQGRSSCTVTGWGRKHFTLGATSNRLSGDIEILPMSFCDRHYNGTRHTSSMVCAAPSSGKLSNPCGGDSGGPLTCQVNAGTNTLMGIVSIGAPCATANQFPDKYTRVEKYLRWISETLQGKLSNAGKDNMPESRGFDIVKGLDILF